MTAFWKRYCESSSSITFNKGSIHSLSPGCQFGGFTFQGLLEGLGSWQRHLDFLQQ